MSPGRSAVRRSGPGPAPALVVKRAVDVLGALVAIVLALPLLAVVAGLIWCTLGRPVLFRHQRPGRHAKPFRLIKFRTMRAPRPGELWYETDAERVTRLGRFLRATSIDELPELLNVLTGRMSLVGPRPLLTEYLEYYDQEQARRHLMRPGITGWAAVNGRHALKFDQRLALDVWYVDHWSLWLDLRIVWLTCRQLVRREDVQVTQDLAEVGFPLPGVRDAGAVGPDQDPDRAGRDE